VVKVNIKGKEVTKESGWTADKLIEPVMPVLLGLLGWGVFSDQNQVLQFVSSCHSQAKYSFSAFAASYVGLKVIIYISEFCKKQHGMS